MGIGTQLGHSSALLLLLTTLTSALYFPQSDLTLRIPYLTRDGVPPKLNLSLVNLRTLRENSRAPTSVTYHIEPAGEKFASIDAKSGIVVLHTLPKSDAPSAIIVQAKEQGNGEAVLEINLHPVPTNGQKINCSAYVQDMCFWNVSKYRIYENQPITLLGRLRPTVYNSICSHYNISVHELLNGTEYFHTIDDVIYSNASLDRDSQHLPGGPGPRADVKVRCVAWDGETGIQYVVERKLSIDILDQDDNPPMIQTENNVEIRLGDFTAGDRLDNYELMVTDADAITSNQYTVELLEDVHNALNITYNILQVDNPKEPEAPDSSVILTRIYARTTLLPKSPYKVILQLRDETLLPGYGEKSVNISLSFVGPQHHRTTSTTAVPLRKPIYFPSNVKIARVSSLYSRVAQPNSKPHSGISFALRGSDAFNITREGGIVYVANTTMLRESNSSVTLKIQWSLRNVAVSSTNLLVTLVDVTRLSNDSCNSNKSINRSCANAESRRECESSCGLASGTFRKDKYASECVWRVNSANNPPAMSERYETCSPDLTYCPDHECDHLERLDFRICPQDCIIESEVHFGETNRDGRGIRSGLGICSCDDMIRCTCAPESVRKRTGGGGGGNGVGKEGHTKLRKDREKYNLLPGPHKVTSSPCGPTCMIGVIAGSFFVLIVIVSTFVTWRYRMVAKVMRRECKHRTEGGTNGLGILPSDYVDRGDGLLIGPDSLTAVNRTLLLPKSCPPDPKWEFPRSRLTIEQVLGEGEFGRVLRAKAINIGDWSGPTTVAVKTLKEGACASELSDLLSEYQLLKEAQHPNVIRLLGACTSPGGPIYLIIEFAEFGSLRNYLRRSRHLESEGRTPCSTSLLSASPCNIREEIQAIEISANYGITPRDILSFAWQISKGMAYLADIKLVHRDLAARNVLLATGKVCKISDFGLTRDVYEDDAYLKRSKGRVPVKWMAPESLADHVYTSKSDVWSFGVLLWELVTLGASPYPGVDVHNLYNLLKAGYRMEKPANCSYQLYKLMISCWHEEPGMRPSFKELTCHWERMLEDGVEYLDLNPRTVHNQAYFASLHALDSPTNSGSDDTSYGNINILKTDAVNYLRKPSAEPVRKCDNIDKLHALWQQPIASFPEEPLKPPYVNEQPANSNVNHYESPIKLRNPSVTSDNENNLKTPPNERPQSYIDMEGNKKPKEQDLLLFNNIDKKIENDVMSNGAAM
ncbi:proto-oncogene tyrosine-protein kinase receptor Ret isoform X2 [Cephus cinctus]|uniref:Proto-oncogene tyrosine-protein kinase receptor Ret isoform X1 n=1 Tax=Cephus cinctus TaxID=211228 RepID=A0AAJ7C7Y9_CEPCN|nr:proto-oncogene tyrosine-protein kinase receptor Ret isoform X1 [Cephus cinctus]XP_015604149.1 proto-oncogene tyrosine-protein kinase receptor Ret isoform X1 [Cephus cinctus]XP_015604150.1 proto-oncogene tyrosine-protein kinase receptor Ret isoform X1 [Cephus cinctus]XP_015604151.1 proto-oncogene tyrosine-protein kinase receptor Ret isoform X2 [Cephus cinctus]